MQKFTWVLFLFSLIALSSCDDKTLSCGETLIEISDAAQNWNSSTADCETYLNAMQRYIDDDCAGTSSLEDYQSIIDTLNCP
jgi:hypothetical protein